MLPVADALIVSNLASGVVFIAGAEITSRHAARTALEKIHGARGHVVGVVLNRVELERHSYYYSQYYRRDYASYYQATKLSEPPALPDRQSVSGRPGHQIAVVFGTRPEAIKCAPVIAELRRLDRRGCRVCVTAQHREMLDQVTTAFGLIPDVDLNLMQPGQGLASFMSRGVEALDTYLKTERPALVLVQGDTTTAFCAALAALYNSIPVGHIEAGLRTWRLDARGPRRQIGSSSHGWRRSTSRQLLRRAAISCAKVSPTIASS